MKVRMAGSSPVAGCPVHSQVFLQVLWLFSCFLWHSAPVQLYKTGWTSTYCTPSCRISKW